MRPVEQRDFRYERLEAMIRAQRVALLVCLLTVLVLTASLFLGRGGSTARGIFVDGKLTVLVRSQKDAEQVSERLLKKAQGNLPGDASFKQSWADETCRTEGRPVVDVARAVATLQPMLSVLVEGTAIRITDAKRDVKDVVVMSTKQLAEAALEKCKQSYVNLLSDSKSVTEVKLLQKVGLADVRIPPDRIKTDVSQAVNALCSGDRPLIVRVITETSKDLDYTAPTQRQPDQSLAKGSRRVLTQGTPGVKRVYARTFYENGKQIRSDILRTEMVREAVPGRVLVGEGATAAPKTSRPG